jgi:putative PEP-CTERM system TPR-repeat lipoprotein
MKRTFALTDRQRSAGRLARWAGVVLTAAILAACAESVPQRLAKVRHQMDAGDFATAVIELKAILQQDATVGDARLLLGRLQLQSGDALSAEAELRRALAGGVPKDEVAPWLAKALLESGQPKKVIAELDGVQPKDAAAWIDLYTSMAEARARVGEIGKAQEVLAVLLGKYPDNSKALLVQARLLANGAAGVDASLKQVAAVLAREPANVEALRLHADLLMFVKRDTPAAIASYRKLVEAAPKRLDGHASLIVALLHVGDRAGAAKQLQALYALAPNNLQGRYFEAQIAYANAEYNKVREIAQQLSKQLPDRVELLELAGAAEVQLRDWPRAEVLLGKAVFLAPNRVVSRQLLARTLIQGGRPEKALETLRPALEAAKPDADSLMVAAEAYLMGGKPDQASALFAKAQQQRPEDVHIQTSAALASFARGQTTQALESLSKIAETARDGQADLALISLLMRRGEFAKASEAIQRYAQKQPNDPQPSVLQAQARSALGDVAGAEKALETAINVDAKYFPAVSGLAQLEVRQGRREAAWARLEKFVVANPGSEGAWLAMAGLAGQMPGARALRREVLGRARAALPASVELGVLTAEQQLSAREATAALATAQALRTAHPTRADVLDLLGRAQMAVGDTRQAQKSFAEMASLAPRLALPHLRQMEAARALGDLPGALKAARRALEVAPDSRVAVSAIVALAAAARQPDQAMQAVRDLRRRWPDDAQSYVLEGDLLASQDKWDQALAAYRAGSTRPEPGLSPIRLHATLIQRKRQDEADAFSRDWRARHPKDARFVGHLGEVALRLKDFGLAEQRFREALVLNPEDASANNNVAWALLQLNKPGALEFARKAKAMAPDHPEFSDTLARALVQSGDLKQAVALQTQLVAQVPGTHRYRLLLAQLLLQAADKPRARQELEVLAKLGSSYDQQTLVKQLLEQTKTP